MLIALSAILILAGSCASSGNSAGKGAATQLSGSQVVESGEAQPKPEATEGTNEPAIANQAPVAVTPSKSNSSTRSVTSASLWVRKGPGSKYSTVRALKKGSIVQVTEVKQVWAKIGSDEYVSEKYLSKTAPEKFQRFRPVK